MKEIKIYEIPNIDFVERIDDPYIGMIFYVADIDTYYSVKTLKEINGVSTKGNKIIEYVIDEYLDFGSGGGGGTGLTPTQLSNIAKIPAIQNNIDNLPNAYAPKTHTHSEYAPKTHRHDASEIDNLPSGGNGESTTIVDNLNSTSTTSALSANQGRVIKSSLDTIANNHLMISVKDFGAKGDGATDDTQAFKNAITKCNETKKTLYIPSGNYLITSSLGEVTNFSILGEKFASEDYYGTLITYTGTNYLLNIGRSHCTIISNIGFIGNKNNNCLNIKQYSGYENLFTNLSFSKFKTAINLDGNDNRLNNILVLECGDESCDSSSTPNYAISGSNGLQNFFNNLHIEHTRYMISSNSTNMFFNNSKFEQSTFGLNSANLSPCIKLGSFENMVGCHLVPITIEAYLSIGVSADDTPYFIECGNSTVINSCIFLVSAGSGNYKFSNPTYKTGKFIKTDKSVITSNYFSPPTRQSTAFNLNSGVFSMNSIYTEGWEVANTTKSFVDLDTVAFNGNTGTGVTDLSGFFVFENKFLNMETRVVATNDKTSLKFTNLKGGDRFFQVVGVNNPGWASVFTVGYRNNGTNCTITGASGGTPPTITGDKTSITINGLNGHSHYYIISTHETLKCTITAV